MSDIPEDEMRILLEVHAVAVEYTKRAKEYLDEPDPAKAEESGLDMDTQSRKAQGLIEDLYGAVASRLRSR